MATRTTLGRIERARVLLAAAGNGELSLKLERIGYDSAALGQGHALYIACDKSFHAVDAAAGAKERCTEAVVAQRRKVRRQYNALAQTADAIFAEDQGVLRILGLVARRRAPSAPAVGSTAGASAPGIRRSPMGIDSQGLLIANARHLYESLFQHPEFMAELAKVGYDEARLHQERLDLGTLEAFDVEQERLKAAAKGCTSEHKAALLALRKWMARFEGVVRPALRDHPDLLDSLGLRRRGRRAAA